MSLRGGDQAVFCMAVAEDARKASPQSSVVLLTVLPPLHFCPRRRVGSCAREDQTYLPAGGLAAWLLAGWRRIQ